MYYFLTVMFYLVCSCCTLKIPQYKDQSIGKCEGCADNRTSSILGFLQWLRFITSQADWVSLSFLSGQKVQLCLYFPLNGRQQ